MATPFAADSAAANDAGMDAEVDELLKELQVRVSGHQEGQRDRVQGSGSGRAHPDTDLCFVGGVMIVLPETEPPFHCLLFCCSQVVAGTPGGPGAADASWRSSVQEGSSGQADGLLRLHEREGADGTVQVGGSVGGVEGEERVCGGESLARSLSSSSHPHSFLLPAPLSLLPSSLHR